MTHHADAVAPDTLAITRLSLHRLAEHVLAAARYRTVGRIGLQVVPGGIATPPFGPDQRTIAVIGDELVVSDAAGRATHGISTLARAAAVAGIVPGGPAEVYRLNTDADPDSLLVVDRDAAAQLAAWFELATAALGAFSAAHADEQPSAIVLWPEHFDLAISIGRCNFGASLGDEGRPEPYLYVGPHDSGARPASDPFWNEPYGAAVSWRQIAGVADAIGFFEAGRSRA
jgi:hypothetical protein